MSAVSRGKVVGSRVGLMSAALSEWRLKVAMRAAVLVTEEKRKRSAKWESSSWTRDGGAEEGTEEGGGMDESLLLLGDALVVFASMSNMGAKGMSGCCGQWRHKRQASDTSSSNPSTSESSDESCDRLQ